MMESQTTNPCQLTSAALLRQRSNQFTHLLVTPTDPIAILNIFHSAIIFNSIQFSLTVSKYMNSYKTCEKSIILPNFKEGLSVV